MTIKGSCHCGANRFEADIKPESATRCTCSICSKSGGLWVYCKPEEVTFEKPKWQSTYRWQSMTVEHNFCPACGCLIYNLSPSWVDYKPDFSHMQVSLNARLFEDFDLDKLPVKVIDGKNLW